MSTKLPKYTQSKMKGNIGEALVQYLLSSFCLVHKIDGSNDVGNDFICELIRDQYPTNLLFYVQVKYTKNPPTIRKETMTYWKGSPIPVYVFWIRDTGLSPSSNPPNSAFIHNLATEAKYKRYTPILHGKHNNDDVSFRNFDKTSFLVDLMEDYQRSQYIKGFTPILKYRDFLTLEDKLEMGLPRHELKVRRIAQEYSKNILDNSWANLFSLAITLWSKDTKLSREKAYKLIEVAISLITKKDRKKYFEITREIEHTYKEWTTQM